MECRICGEDGFEVMPVLQAHIDAEHTEKPDTEKQLNYLTCMNCGRKNYYCVDDPGTLDNVEHVEDDEYSLKITCKCGELIEGV
ncbi:hypothetical protein OB919_15930 [Halobacteria archaeon AArc-curdl1]|uniref:Uncharacterized protein n=1 Tax=Natronosalvus hydrolyticus TaxID=2979988 RepID=A0AAP2ZCR9_9EURY|nr:hypothetical protein [Halobacteria archaeon AArc-curdl1]